MILGRDFPVTLGFTVALVGLPLFVRGRAIRLKAVLLIVAYAVYAVCLWRVRDGGGS